MGGGDTTPEGARQSEKDGERRKAQWGDGEKTPRCPGGGQTKTTADTWLCDYCGRVLGARTLGTGSFTGLAGGGGGNLKPPLTRGAVLRSSVAWGGSRLALRGRGRGAHGVGAARARRWLPPRRLTRSARRRAALLTRSRWRRGARSPSRFSATAVGRPRHRSRRAPSARTATTRTAAAPSPLPRPPHEEPPRRARGAFSRPPQS